MIRTLLFGMIALLAETPDRHDIAEVVAVDLKMPRQTYLVGEPVRFDFLVRNISPHRIEVGIILPYIQVFVGRQGEAVQQIHQEACLGTYGTIPFPLEPGEGHPCHLQVLYQYILEQEQHDPFLVFPDPGDYEVKIRFPIFCTAITSKGSNQLWIGPIHVHIQNPQDEDAIVYQKIKDFNTRYFLRNSTPLYIDSGSDMETVWKIAHLLKDHPDTGYRHAFRAALLEFYRKTLKNYATPEDPDREFVREVLGEPDDRLYPDDARLGQELVLEYPNDTRFRDLLASLQERFGVPLSASPFYRRDQARMGLFRSTWSLRSFMRFTGPMQEGSAWVRRGQGYYLYSETLVSSKGREELEELLGPVEVLFPDDPRLDVEVVADCPEPTPIDQVVASYAEQSGVPLKTSPFFQRCRQAGGKLTLNLRHEMAYLARTFDARWERDGEGYILSAGKEADSDELPPEARKKADSDAPPSDAKVEKAEPARGESPAVLFILGGLAVVSVAVLATVLHRIRQRRQRLVGAGKPPLSNP